MHSETLNAHLSEVENIKLEDQMRGLSAFLTKDQIEGFRWSLLSIIENSSNPEAIKIASNQLEMLELSLGQEKLKFRQSVSAVLHGTQEGVVPGLNTQAANDESYSQAA